MGKNKKQQQKKQQGHSVFKVAGSKISKSKNKPKAVTSNLKRINSSTKSQTETIDAEFQEVAKSLLTPSPAGDKQSKEAAKVKPKSSKGNTEDEAPPDVAKTAEDLAKL